MPSISHICESYAYQSYHSSTYYERAILSQPTSQLIVPSTKKTFQRAGSVVGVSAYSDTPVAIQFHGGASGVVLCRPGQAISGKFSGFDYGLPFGWLGGGNAVILIGHDADARLDLGAARPEIVFHRTRLAIEASAGALPTLKRNWPLRFPWAYALGDAGIDQRGTPMIRVEPTRTTLRLRAQITVPTNIGLVFREPREFDEQSDGTYSPNDYMTAAYCEMTFRPSTDPELAFFSVEEIPERFLHLACDDGGVTALSLGNAAMEGVEIDVVRYGRI